jgi:hypothetical protein
MGDRVLFQVWRRIAAVELEVSPVIYGHWSGSDAPAIVQSLQKRMKGREGDVQYTAARCVQEICGNDTGNLGVGLWNAKARLTANDSHGDAGVVLIECTPEGLRFQCLGGYLRESADGAAIMIEGGCVYPTCSDENCMGCGAPRDADDDDYLISF